MGAHPGDVILNDLRAAANRLVEIEHPSVSVFPVIGEVGKPPLRLGIGGHQATLTPGALHRKFVLPTIKIDLSVTTHRRHLS